jgi:uncharacterized RDD family membrane protein YckC
MTTTGAARFNTIPAEARAFYGDTAGVVTRTFANVIDVLVAAGIVVAGYFAVSGVLFLRRGASFTFPTVSYAAAYWAGFAVLIAYFTWSWATTGRTVGDRLLGLRVHRKDGRTVGWGRALVRAVLCAAFPMLLVWVAIDGERRSVQDIIVGTRVIYDWGGSPAGVSDDPVGMAVDVAPAVADEAGDRDAESVAGLDGQ